MDITITRPGWTKNMSLKTWAKGTEYAVAYVTGPDKDKGTVYLKSGNDVYNYLPKIKKTAKLVTPPKCANIIGKKKTCQYI